MKPVVMINSADNCPAEPLERRTTGQLRAIARALRARAKGGRYARSDLSREIARIERLIASRSSHAASTS